MSNQLAYDLGLPDLLVHHYVVVTFILEWIELPLPSELL